MARAKAVLERAPVEAPARTARKPRKQRRRIATPRKVYERRYVQTIRSVDLWSVLKVSICFYLCALVVLLLTGVMLWWIASAAGVVGNIEQFVGELISSSDGENEFQFLSWSVLRATTLIGLVVVCILTVVTVLAAAFYNLFSELLGGVEVTVVEEEELRR
jgi:hypothetical protein